MMFTKNVACWLRAGVLSASALVPAAVYADETRDAGATGSAMLAKLQPMDSDDLSQQAGGAEPLSIALASNSSNVTGNQIGGIGSTGVVNGNSLSNNSGLTTLIANSGNQVVISQSTIVNVFLH